MDILDTITGRFINGKWVGGKEARALDEKRRTPKPKSAKQVKLDELKKIDPTGYAKYNWKKSDVKDVQKYIDTVKSNPQKVNADGYKLETDENYRKRLKNIVETPAVAPVVEQKEQGLADVMANKPQVAKPASQYSVTDVINFQKANGLNPDGKLGKNTEAAMRGKGIDLSGVSIVKDKVRNTDKGASKVAKEQVVVGVDPLAKNYPTPTQGTMTYKDPSTAGIFYAGAPTAYEGRWTSYSNGYEGSGLMTPEDKVVEAERAAGLANELAKRDYYTNPKSVGFMSNSPENVYTNEGGRVSAFDRELARLQAQSR